MIGYFIAPSPLELVCCFGIMPALIVLAAYMLKRSKQQTGPLVTCAGCRRRISAFAANCPNCGRPRMPSDI
jgi:predicted amidophosphoribosyltransferase